MKEKKFILQKNQLLQINKSIERLDLKMVLESHSSFAVKFHKIFSDNSPIESVNLAFFRSLDLKFHFGIGLRDGW
jgi:hypothetical protein